MNILYNFNPADASRPSFFEMFIQTQMMPSLKPAIKYMFSVCINNYFIFYLIIKITLIYYFSDLVTTYPNIELVLKIYGRTILWSIIYNGEALFKILRYDRSSRSEKIVRIITTLQTKLLYANYWFI